MIAVAVAVGIAVLPVAVMYGFSLWLDWEEYKSGYGKTNPN